MTTYLCPALGKVHAELHHDKCHPTLLNPLGKNLQVSYIGINPYIKHNPFGGSEYKVVRLLSEKFGFLPHFVPERTFDITKSNGTTYGMVYRVSLLFV